MTNTLIGRSGLRQVSVAVALVMALGLGLEAGQPQGRAPEGWPVMAAFYRQQIHDAGIVGSSLVLVRDGRVTAEEYVGFEDLDRKRPVDRETIYHWASITKTFTAIAIMQLRDRGLVGLDDPVAKYVPEIRRLHNPFGDGSQITVRDAPEP